MSSADTVHVHSLVVTPLEENCYIVWNDTGDCVVFDPGGEEDRILAALDERKLKPALIVNTHGHIDHVGANAALRTHTGARIGIHALDAPMLSSSLLCGADWVGLDYVEHEPDFLYAEGDIVGTGSLLFEAYHTPGHSPGSCILLNRAAKVLVGGDLVFAGSVGRWDLPGGDQEVLFQSIAEKFIPLPQDVVIYPGHGPKTTVGRELQSNPFVAPLARALRTD
jgi:glyoxylase-like metal-dependent hydrolase (beta-lactamase superfamily II)